MEYFISKWKTAAVAEKLLCLYTIFIPFLDIFYIKFANKRIIWADFIFVILFVVWISRYFKGGADINKTSMELPLLLMLCSFIISFINSVNLLDSCLELGSLIYLAFLFILIVNIASGLDKLYLLLFVYISTCTFISSLGLWSLFVNVLSGNLGTRQLLTYNKIEAVAHHFPRLKLTFESPNMALAYLHVGLIFGVILFLLERKRSIRIFIILSIIIMLIAAFFTGSRRFTGLLLSLFIISCWYGRARIISVFKYLSFLGFVVFLVISFITTIWVVFPVNITKDNAKVIKFQAHYSYSLHLLQYVTSFRMIKEHPILGVGLGTYNRRFKQYVDWHWLKSSFGFEAYPDHLKQVERKTLIFDPHCVFLGTFAETGIIGFFGLLYFFLQYINLLMRKFRKSENFTPQRVLSGCILAGFIGFMLNGITMDILSMRHFWFMMAIGLSYKNK
jgi:O-antigen ligase